MYAVARLVIPLGILLLVDALVPPRDLPDRRRSVVYLEAAPATIEGGARVRASMDQRNETFVPHVLAVRSGTVVDFPNSDPIYHNVFSLSRVVAFDLGRYAAGRSKSVRFERPGVVRVFCDIHSHMSAFVLVFGHEYFALTAEDGSYRLEHVPPGTHTVAVWNEIMAPASRQARVPERGGEVEVNFVLTRK